MDRGKGRMTKGIWKNNGTHNERIVNPKFPEEKIWRTISIAEGLFILCFEYLFFFWIH